MSNRAFRSSEFLDRFIGLASGRAVGDATTRPSLAPPVGDDEFLAMLHAMRPSGGLIRTKDLQARRDAMSIRKGHGVQVQSINCWLETRQAFGLAWSGQFWFPMLQFDTEEARPYPAVARLLRVLDDTFDDREIALWFVTPNFWLEQRAPAALLASNAPDLIHAARADRYVARG